MPDPKFTDAAPSSPPWKLIHQAADTSEPAMRRAWLQAVLNTKNGIPTRKAAEAIAQGQPEKAIAYALEAWQKNGPAWRNAVQREYLKIVTFIASPDIAARLLPAVKGVNYQFNLTNPYVWDAINSQVDFWFDDLAASMRDVIRQTVTAGFREGFAPYEMARRMRDAIGLDTKGFEAVANYEKFLRQIAQRDLKALPPSIMERLRRSDIRYFSRKSLDESRIQRILQRYRERKIMERAELFSRTATIAGSDEAQRQLWNDARRQGYLDPARFEVKAITTPDDRRCPKCLSMNGKRREMNGVYTEGYYAGSGGPPFHPYRCRCAEGIVRKAQALPVAA